MVDLICTNYLLLADASTDTVLERLEPERRAAVVLALVGLALLGVLLAVITMLAGRWARHERPLRGTRLGRWARGRTHRQPKISNRDLRHGETMVSDQDSEDTRA